MPQEKTSEQQFVTAASANLDSEGRANVVFKAREIGTDFRIRSTLASVHYLSPEILSVDLGHNFFQGLSGRVYIGPDCQLNFENLQRNPHFRGLTFMNGLEGVHYKETERDDGCDFSAYGYPEMKLDYSITDGKITISEEHVPSRVSRVLTMPTSLSTADLAGELDGHGQKAEEIAEQLGIQMYFEGPIRGFMRAFHFTRMRGGLVTPWDVVLSPRGGITRWLWEHATELNQETEDDEYWKASSRIGALYRETQAIS